MGGISAESCADPDVTMSEAIFAGYGICGCIRAGVGFCGG